MGHGFAHRRPVPPRQPADADQAPESDPLVSVDYDALEAVSVNEAIRWAMEQPCPVTLYLYDEGGGFSDDEEHFHNVAVRFEADEDDQPG